MIIVIRRSQSTPDGTPGRLTTDAGFSCDTLELPWADNRRGVSCIKPDSYIGWVWRSPSMGRSVVRLEDKHGRRDCLIHNGNFAGDQDIDADHDGKADKFTQVRGCTLVGMGFGILPRPDGKGHQFGVLSSKDTLARLVAHLGSSQHTFIYTWADGCAP